MTAEPPDEPASGKHDDSEAGTLDVLDDPAGSGRGVLPGTHRDRNPGGDSEVFSSGRSASLGPGDRVVPTWTDPTVRRASDLIGGPMGRHAVVGRAMVLTPLRVCLAMAIVVLICGWLYKAACIQQTSDGNGGVVLDQSGERPWITGCYNDVVPLYGSHRLDTQQLPYATSWDDNGERHYMEYPVVTGYWMWGVSEVSHWYGQLAAKIGLPVPLPVAGYFTVNAILLGLFFLVAVACTARIARRRIWDTAIMCLSPLLVVHAFTNWDLLAVGITAAAMWAWSRGRPEPGIAGPTPARAVGILLVVAQGAPGAQTAAPGSRLVDSPDQMITEPTSGSTGGGSPRPRWVSGWVLLSGALIGLGTAAKLYPVLLLGPLLVLCLRAGRMRQWWTAAVVAALVWAAINVPVIVAYPTGWFEFIKLNSERPAEYDSWYYLFASISHSTVFDAARGAASPTFLNWLSLAAFGIACLAIGWLAMAVRRRPRVAQLVFLVVATFLLTNKVWSPQYSLWLLPLVVLALPRWRPVLAWQFAEVVVWVLLMLTFDGDSGKNLPIYPFLAAAILRDVLLIALMVRVVREMLRPEHDLVRMAGEDDPTGGVLDGAADRRRLPALMVSLDQLPDLSRFARSRSRNVPGTNPDDPGRGVRERGAGMGARDGSGPTVGEPDDKFEAGPDAIDRRDLDVDPAVGQPPIPHHVLGEVTDDAVGPARGEFGPADPERAR